MATVLSEEVASVEVERTNGRKILRIRIAPELENTIRDAVKGQTVDFNNQKFNGTRYPVIENTPQFKRWASKFVLNRPDLGLDHDQTYNFSFIFIEGISNGLELEFGGLYSEEFLMDYAQNFEHFIQEMYNEFVSPISIVAELKLRTIRA